MKTTLALLIIIKLYGFVSSGMKHHYFIKPEKSWHDAQQYCKTHYHDLSTFVDEIEEQQFLVNVGRLNIFSYVGLYKDNNIWKWSGGELARQISWDKNQPDEDYCACMKQENLKLHDVRCTDSLSFFCMKVSEIVAVHQSEAWEGALEHCRHHYEDLASLSSNRSMTDALRKITEAKTEYVWIGLRFLAGHWFWISGDDLVYNAWSSDGPPQCPAQNQRCGALDKITKTWTNRDCEEKLDFLCFND